MKGVVKLTIGLLGLGLFAILQAGAQPGSQMRGGRMMMGAGGGSPEQILGFLAFDDKVGLKDDQLLKLRGALKETYQKHLKMRETMQSGEGDFEEMRQQIQTLQGEIEEKAAGILDEKQLEQLKTYLQNLSQGRGSRGGQPSGPPR